MIDIRQITFQEFKDKFLQPNIDYLEQHWGDYQKMFDVNITKNNMEYNFGDACKTVGGIILGVMRNRADSAHKYEIINSARNIWWDSQTGYPGS